MTAAGERHSLADEAATLAFGAGLAALPAPQVIFLHGDLGAGKTTLVRGYLRARGFEGTVRSPTYTLMESYTLGDGLVVHFDLYRMADPEEIHALGLRELLQEGAVLFFEWPERGAGALPDPTLQLFLAPEGAGRMLSLTAP